MDKISSTTRPQSAAQRKDPALHDQQLPRIQRNQSVILAITWPQCFSGALNISTVRAGKHFASPRDQGIVYAQKLRRR